MHYKNVRIVTVQGSHFANSSTIVEELAFSLSAGHDYIALDGGGFDNHRLLVRDSSLVCRQTTYGDQKFKRRRMLWANIVGGYTQSVVVRVR